MADLPLQKPPLGSALLAALAALAIASSPARGEQIGESMSWALRSSFDIRADDQRQVAADARVLGAYEAFLPTLNYNFNSILDSHISYSPDLDTLSNGAGVIDTIARREPNAQSFQLALPLFDGFKRVNELRAAQTNARAGRALHDDKREQVLLDTAAAYLAVLRDRAIVGLRKTQLSGVQTVSHTIDVKLAAHDATIADSALAESRVEAARTAVDQAEADLAASEQELFRLAGPTSSPSDLPPIPEDLLPRSIDELRQALATANPKLIAARLAADSADFTAKAAYARFSPQLTFLLSKSRQNSISTFAYNVHDTTALVQLRIPLYNPGEFSDVLGERAIARQKGYEALDLERTIGTQASIAFTRRQATIAQIRTAKRRVANLRKAVAAQNISAKIGLLTVADVLNTVAELSEAQIALCRLEYARDQTTYALLAALNRLVPRG